MATWVRSFTADLTGSADLDMSGPADLDTDTAPGDFDETAVTAVRLEATLSHTGTFGTGTGRRLAQPEPRRRAKASKSKRPAAPSSPCSPPAGQVTDGTATVAIDETDNSPNTGASSADWQGAQFNGTNGGVVTDFAQGKGPDGTAARILAASVTVTITYTPGGC